MKYNTKSPLCISNNFISYLLDRKAIQTVWKKYKKETENWRKTWCRWKFPAVACKTCKEN